MASFTCSGCGGMGAILKHCKSSLSTMYYPAWLQILKAPFSPAFLHVLVAVPKSRMSDDLRPHDIPDSTYSWVVQLNELTITI